MNRRLVAAIAITVVTAACSSSASTTTSASDPTGAPTVPAPTTPAPTTAAPTTAAPTTVTTDAVGDGDLRSLAGLAAVELLDPAPAGIRPTLQWQPVDGADHYRVVVRDGDGNPYWAWLGTGTSVPFGGAETENGILASVHAPMTWVVVAVDAEGRTIAISDQGDLPGG